MSTFTMVCYKEHKVAPSEARSVAKKNLQTNQSIIIHLNVILATPMEASENRCSGCDCTLNPSKWAQVACPQPASPCCSMMFCVSISYSLYLSDPLSVCLSLFPYLAGSPSVF